MMREKGIGLAAAALLAATAACAYAELAVSYVGYVQRDPVTNAVEISGVTWAGGDLYYAVDDEGARQIFPLTIVIDPATGKISSHSIGEGVVVAGAVDMEGCAYDPISGNVWVSDEGQHKMYKPLPKIREIDQKTGKAIRSLPIPPVQYERYGNFSFEALTMSGDGLTMWTCNEEALKCDGPRASLEAGSTVRLTKFTRPSGDGDWKEEGEWAYVTDPIQGRLYANRSRSGVSALCVLPDGTLLALERELHSQKGLFIPLPDFRLRIYQVDFTGATEISSFPALTNATFKATSKRLLIERDTGFANYEGMCLGPRLDDGSSTLVLVSDGGNDAKKEIMTMRLTGLDVKSRP